MWVCVCLTCGDEDVNEDDEGGEEEAGCLGDTPAQERQHEEGQQLGRNINSPKYDLHQVHVHLENQPIGRQDTHSLHEPANRKTGHTFTGRTSQSENRTHTHRTNQPIGRQDTHSPNKPANRRRGHTFTEQTSQ